MPLDGHEVLSIAPSKLWIVILGRRNCVSKGREQDECSEHQVDDMIPLPCWSGAGVGGTGLGHSKVGGAGSPSWNQLRILSWALVLSRFAPLNSGSPHIYLDRKCQLSYFLLKLQRMSSKLLWPAKSWCLFHISPCFFPYESFSVWYDTDKPQCWISLSYEVKVAQCATPWTMCLSVHPHCNPGLHSLA